MILFPSVKPFRTQGTVPQKLGISLKISHEVMLVEMENLFLILHCTSFELIPPMNFVQNYRLMVDKVDYEV